MKSRPKAFAQAWVFAAFLSSSIFAVPAYAQTRHSTPSKVAVSAPASTQTAAARPNNNSSSTPSKVAVQTPAASASDARANVPVLEASLSLTPTSSAPTSNHDQLGALVQSLQTTPSKVAVSTVPAIATSSQTQRNSAAALGTYLSSPAKTPVAALDAHSIRSSGLPFDVEASIALIVDQDTREVLYSKNPQNVVPIASITKLMTAMVVLDAKQPMGEMITITQADVDTLKNSSSRLSVGARLTRRELLHLALMSSENRAAHALARRYPGGTTAFVRAMNNKAQALGMSQTRYIEPTGLSSQNRSSARDLVWLVKAAYDYDMIRQLSTSSGYQISIGKRQVNYINSNRLTHNANWQIGVQKTGYIREAGHCLVMQATISNRRLIMVFLDSSGSTGRINDAEKMRNWVTAQARQNTVASRRNNSNL